MRLPEAIIGHGWLSVSDTGHASFTDSMNGPVSNWTTRNPIGPFVELVRSRMLHEVLADTLRGRILNGELLSGEQVDEGALARHYGVARPSVREAVKTLAREGLIEVGEAGCHIAMPRADEIAFARELLTQLERCAKVRDLILDTQALEQAAAGNPAALPAAPTERLLVAALLPIWRRLALANPANTGTPLRP